MKERNIIVYDNRVFIVNTCDIWEFYGTIYETMIAEIDIELIKNVYYEGNIDYDIYPFDLSTKHTINFIVEWGEECVEPFDLYWKGQKQYNNYADAFSGHLQACKNPIEWILKN